MIIVSACLCGINCKYSGGNNLDEKVLKMFKEGKAIPVCPEQLGGLTTPRLPQEIVSGSGEDVLVNKAKVISIDGINRTNEYIKGAQEVLKIAKSCNADLAILKADSPSCGTYEIYDGTFSGRKINGSGVTAALLKQNGIKVISENEIK